MTLPDQMRPFSAPSTEPIQQLSPDRLAHLLRIEAALDTISSASPAMREPGTTREQSCALCHALIDEARNVLGYERWPAIPHTPVASPSDRH